MLICFISILIAEFQCNSLVLPCVLLYVFKSITLRGAHQPRQTTKESTMQKKMKSLCLEGSLGPAGDNCFRKNGDE